MIAKGCIVKTRSVICRGQVRTIEDAVEAWRAGHDDAMEARDIEDVIPVCLMLGELLQEWHKDAWESLFSNRLRNVQSAGELLRKAYVHSLEAFDGVADCLRGAKQKGYEVDKAADFQRTAESVQRLNEDFSRRWPFLDAADVEAARAPRLGAANSCPKRTSSMSYTVRIAQMVREDIASWNLSRTIKMEVYNRLRNDLPRDPDGLLGERIVPLMAFAYTFSLTDDRDVPYRLHFLFAVDRHDDARELHIVGCRLTSEDRGEN